MPKVASINYATQRITLSAETVDANLDTLDVYREVVALRKSTAAHRQYPPMIEAGGNVEKVAGVSYTLPYARLLNGCRIVPYNTSHAIKLVRDTFTDDGLAGRDCFDRTTLSASVAVDIDVDFPEIETRVVSVGGSNVITGDIATVLAAIPSAGTNADAVRTELAVELARIDVAVSSVSGGSGATPEDVADAVLAAAQVTPIHADVRKTVGTSLHGDGSEANKFRSVLVP